MRIGIEARIFKYREYKGIANTTFNILREWMKLYPEHEYFLISNSEIYFPVDLPENWNLVIRGKNRNGLFWTLFELPGIICDLKLDVLWGPNFLLPPPKGGCRYVVTVHDLALFRFKGTASAGTYLTLKILGKKSCEWADKVIAISEATANDITTFYGISRNKIAVCMNGYSAEGAAQSFSRNKFSCDSDLQKHPFFLFLSTIEPRKNPGTVLCAFEKFTESLPEKKARLVFAGGMGWNNGDFNKELQDSKCRDRIVLAGYVDGEEKQWLLSHAKVLLYPSLYEGFGLPILEAMANGTPVVTSAVSSMPEVGGEAAFYLKDPKDADELLYYMKKCMDLNENEKREMQTKMIKQVQKFSWEKCAKEIMQQFSDSRIAEAQRA